MRRKKIKDSTIEDIVTTCFYSECENCPYNVICDGKVMTFNKEIIEKEIELYENN